MINEREYLRSPCYVHFWSEPAFAPGERMVWYLRTENSFYVNAEEPLSEISATKMEACTTEEAMFVIRQLTVSSPLAIPGSPSTRFPDL